MKPLRVVLDTNVLVSALVFGGGQWAWLRGAWQSRRLVPLVSRGTVDELLRVLAYPKFRLGADDQETILADYLPYAEVIEVREKVRGLPGVRDGEDAKFLALALSGRADALVSGDDDLLSLREDWKRIPVLTPAEFQQWIEKQEA